MKLILSSFLIFFLTVTHSQAGIREDYRYFLELTTSKTCLKLIKHMSKIARNDEILFIKAFGGSWVPNGLEVKNSKQRKFLEIVKEGNSIIKPEDKDAILSVFNQVGCQFDPNNITDVVLRGILERAILARADLVKKLKNGSAKYSDVWIVQAGTNAIMEEFLTYVIQKDPSILDDFMNDFQVYMQVLEKSMIPILKIIDKYDLQT